MVRTGDQPVRAGAQSLGLLAPPLNVHVLAALREGPKATPELQHAAGKPPATTLREHLSALTQIGLLKATRNRAFPTRVVYELEAAGRALEEVSAAVRDWLSKAPGGGLAIGGPGAETVIKALIGGWSTAIVSALASHPCMLTQLDEEIRAISYPSLERRLGAMRLAGQIAPCQSAGRRGTAFTPSTWLRLAVVPLAAGAAWERAHGSGLAPQVERLDVEAAFRLVLPLLTLPPTLSGLARISVELTDQDAAVVEVGLKGGSIALGRPSAPDVEISAPFDSWLRFLAGGNEEDFRVVGSAPIAAGLAMALRRNCFQ